jgi:hypothetical protein
LRLSVEFQWFLTALSVRPGRSFAMTAHLLPCAACALIMTASSHWEKGSFLTSGFSWLHQRRRHDLPERPRMPAAMTDQFLGPYSSISRRSRSSSCAVVVGQRSAA